jgi:hypothetical protein
MIPNGVTGFDPKTDAPNEDSNNTVIQKWMRMMNIAKPRGLPQELIFIDAAQNLAAQTQETLVVPDDGLNLDTEILEQNCVEN